MDKPGQIELIGRFQLENFTGNFLQFVFLNVSKKPNSDLPEELRGLFESSQFVEMDKAVDRVQELAADKFAPIVLFCENGKRSMKVAKQLEKLEYINICVLEGGIKGL